MQGLEEQILLQRDGYGNVVEEHGCYIGIDLEMLSHFLPSRKTPL